LGFGAFGPTGRTPPAHQAFAMTDTLRPSPLLIIGLGLAKDTRKTVVTGVEMFNKTLNEGQAGDNVGLLLRGIEKKDLERGQVIAKPGSITPHTKFHAQVYVLTKDEGGRHTPFFAGYKPQFYFRTTDVTGGVLALMTEAGKPAEMCMPGDNITMDIEIISPIAMEEGLRFAIREGGRTVGAGVVTKVIAWWLVVMAKKKVRESMSGSNARVQSRNYRTEISVARVPEAGVEKFCNKERKHTVQT
jgi:hypothetical protein